MDLAPHRRSSARPLGARTLIWSGLALAAALLLGCAHGGSGGGSSGAGASAAPSSGTFSALSYNVAGLPDLVGPSEPTVFIPQISPLLNAYDLVLVQEDFFFHSELIADATHPYISQPQPHPYMHSQLGAIANDGLNRLGIHPFTDHVRETWIVCHGLWSNAADCLAIKGFSVARHELAPGVEVDVYNHHADAGRGGGDKAARSIQFEQLADHIAARSAGLAVIVAGDTNLRSSDLDDEAILQTFKARAGLRDAARHLGAGVEKIDRFLFRGGADVDIEPLSWRMAPEFIDPSGQPLSDHDAIHVDFRWTALR